MYTNTIRLAEEQPVPRIATEGWTHSPHGTKWSRGGLVGPQCGVPVWL